ncbi:hypothetical protein [Labrys wisconsinensis]|uniref:Uncharacterized protein n=1 Tax=Labrys wisconsinensis TaxID=425677 RepID=A0ABU0JMF9_9HYPH|nr:hypothetical protein [Labrys wisconsinensis]MDQ0474810.1 hypothetical protein [Labrys wisconsinensis]
MLISAKNAVVSLGVSCQTAYQIRRHERLIAAALKDQDLAWQSSFFSNLIAPASAVVSLFSSGGAAEVLGEDIELSRRARWKAHGLFFWHDRFDRELLSSKYTYLLNKTIRLLRSVNNIVFIVSNTQNNLLELSREIETMDPRIHEHDASEMVEVVTNFFGDKCRFLFVVNPDIGHVPHILGKARGYVIEHDTGAWYGNTVAWQLILRQFLGYYNYFPDDRAQSRLDQITERYETLSRQHMDLRSRYNALREKLKTVGPLTRQSLPHGDLSKAAE